MKSGNYTIAGNVSSQYITGLLFAAALISGATGKAINFGGKTFKTTIGAKGQINLNVGAVTAKGTYKAVIKFAGTGTYAAANSQTITVKMT